MISYLLVYRKIDPELVYRMRTASQEDTTVILYASDINQCRSYLDKMELEIKYELPFIGAYSVKVPYKQLKDLAVINQVKYLEADVSVKAVMNIASQEVGARLASDSGYTGKGVGIAFIDTGIYPHADFIRPQNRIREFVDFVNQKKTPYDDNGHGSFVAGVAAGNGYSSRGRYAGIAPEADIIALKAMDKNGEGTSSDILGAMQWIADHHEEYNIRVVSMSFGSQTRSLSRDSLSRGAEALWSKGITVVAAAGNSGPDYRTITSPGVSSSIITVGAVDDKRTIDIDDDEIAEFSSRGPVGGSIKPDIVAPGVDVVSVNSDVEYVPGSRVRAMATPYTTMSGTSVATPIVSGASALLLQKNPSWTPSQVKKSLMDGAVRITDDPYAEGSGIISIKQSMDL